MFVNFMNSSGNDKFESGKCSCAIFIFVCLFILFLVVFQPKCATIKKKQVIQKVTSVKFEEDQKFL